MRLAIDEYSKALEEFENDLFIFVRSILQHPTSSKQLEEIMIWGLDFFDYGSSTTIVNLKDISEQLGDEEKVLVLGELNHFLNYKR